MASDSKYAGNFSLAQVYNNVNSLVPGLCTVLVASSLCFTPLRRSTIGRALKAAFEKHGLLRIKRNSAEDARDYKRSSGAAHVHHFT